MIYIKASIVTTLLLLCLLVGYIFFAFDSDYGLNIAYESFSRGHYDQALTEIKHLGNAVAPDRAKLYEGYIYRAKKQWAESNSALKEAEALAKKHHQPTLHVEIALNEALNAYLQEQPDALSSALARAAEVSPQDPWVEIFRGLEAFQRENFTKALEIWSRPNHRVPYSSWMSSAFNQVFTPSWFSLHLARCQIETGKYLAARRSLETALKESPDVDAAEINFLIGLSYIKEAQEKPLSAAAPYYKLAMAYFGKVPMQQERFARDHQHVLDQIKLTTLSLIQQGSFADVPFYVSILENGHAQEAINVVTQQLVALLNQQLESGQWPQIKDLTALLHRILPEGEGREKLEQRFQQMADSALESGDLEHATDYWEIARLYSRDPSQFMKAFATKLSSKILSSLPQADPDLTRIRPYLVFWQNIENDPQARSVFAQQLVSYATQLLTDEEAQAKGLAILKMALVVPLDADQSLLSKGVESGLAKQYETALRKQDLDQLPILLAAIQGLGFSSIDLHKNQEIPKQLVAAEKLVKEEKYDEAMKHAKWALALDGENQPARLLAGRIFYWQANYAEALRYLTSVSAPDLDVLESIAVSQLLAGNPQEGLSLLHNIERRRPLKTESLIRLGLGLLIQGNAAAAREWLTQVKVPDAEVYTGLTYAAVREKNWIDASNYQEKITPPYRDLDAIQGLAIRIDMAQGEYEKAEKQLMALLAKRADPPIKPLWPPFQQFFQYLQRQLNRYIVAGLFFKNIKKDNEIALKYLNLNKDPSPETRLLKGEALLALNRPAEAVRELQLAYRSTDDIEVQRVLMPLIASALESSGREVEALGWYRDFFALDSTTLSHRQAYAQLLMKLLRYDLAAEQYAILEKKQPLTMEQEVAYIKSLTLKGSFEEAIKAGKTVLEEKSPFNLVQKLAVARMMVIANAQELTWPLLKQMPPSDKLSADELNAFIQFLVEAGSYMQATTLVSQYRDKLSKSVDYLLTIADLLIRLDQKNEAWKTVQEALKREPNNPEALAFFRRYLAGPQTLLKTLQTQKSESEKGSANLSSKLDYARTLDSLVRAEPSKLEQFKADFRTTALLLKKMDSDLRGVPELHFLQGEMQRFLNNKPAAIDHYLAAGRLAPSYADALLELGNLYRQQKDEKRAISVFYQVTRYAPDNAAAWQTLAEIYSLDGYLFEASNFYQNAIKFRPNKLDNYLALAKVFLQLRGPEDAKAILERAVKLWPNNVEALKLLLTTLTDSALTASFEDPKTLMAERRMALRRLQALAPNEAEKFSREMDLYSNNPGILGGEPQDLNTNPLFVPSERKGQ